MLPPSPRRIQYQQLEVSKIFGITMGLENRISILRLLACSLGLSDHLRLSFTSVQAPREVIKVR